MRVPKYECRLVRCGSESYGPPKVRFATDLLPLMSNFFKDKIQEEFVVFTLDGAHQVKGMFPITKGLVDKTHVHPREVFRPAIVQGACAVILAHNHPSNALTPSREDREVTQQLKNAGEMLGIPVLDHIICSVHGINYFSFCEEGCL